jgi:ABC-type phosphate/phosphonate transport system substrate-binding protein
MKTRLLFALMAVVALAVSAATAADEKAAAKAEDKASVVKGEVLDLSCYLGHGGMGEGHAGCAAKCVKGGAPVGLLGADGTVYVLYADHSDGSPYEQVKDLAGKKVEVTGDVASKSGMKGLTVHAVKAL